MALGAREMGFDSLVAFGAEPGVYHGITIVKGVQLEGMEIRQILGAMKRAKSDSSLICANAGDNSFNRALMNIPGIRVLRNLHASPKKSFDQVTARMASDKRVAVDIDLSSLIQLRGSARQKAIQRYSDAVMLQDKFGFPFTLSTGARSILEMRSGRDMKALCTLIDLPESGVEDALRAVGTLCNPEGPVKVVQ
jgi:ribonuclease P/MRP protein subunit RPP1